MRTLRWRDKLALYSVCVSFFLYDIPGTARADNTPDPAVLQSFTEQLKKVGISYEQAGLNVDVFADQQTALAAIPSLQSLGAINPALTKTDIDAHPLTYSGVIAMYAMAVILPFIYTNSHDDFIHVKIYLLSPNDYGNTQKHEMLSFDFNRELFQKVNWDNIKPENLMKISPTFTFAKWYEEALRKE